MPEWRMRTTDVMGIVVVRRECEVEAARRDSFLSAERYDRQTAPFLLANPPLPCLPQPMI